jgi:H+/Cl- antiporter ClcA
LAAALDTYRDHRQEPERNPSGQPRSTRHPGSKSVGALVLIVARKIVALSLCMATGFRGGRGFPVVFIGGTLGLAIHQAFTSVPLAVAAAAGMAGAAMTFSACPSS